MQAEREEGTPKNNAFLGMINSRTPTRTTFALIAAAISLAARRACSASTGAVTLIGAITARLFLSQVPAFFGCPSTANFFNERTQSLAYYAERRAVASLPIRSQVGVVNIGILIRSSLGGFISVINLAVMESILIVVIAGPKNKVKIRVVARGKHILLIVPRDETHSDVSRASRIEGGGVLAKDRVPIYGTVGREGNIDFLRGDFEKGIAVAVELIVPTASKGLRDRTSLRLRTSLRFDGMLVRRSEKDSCCCNCVEEHLGE